MKRIAVLHAKARIYIELEVPGGKVLSRFREQCEKEFNALTNHRLKGGEEKTHLVALSIYLSQRERFGDFLREFCKKYSLELFPLNL